MPFGDAAQCGHDLAGRAVAALECVLVDERLLQRVKFAALGKTLDGGDVRAVMHHRKRQAGVDPPTIDQHRAGTAGSWSQPFLVPGNPARSRNMSNSEVRLSTAISRCSPLIWARTTVV